VLSKLSMKLHFSILIVCLRDITNTMEYSNLKSLMKLKRTFG